MPFLSCTDSSEKREKFGRVDIRDKKSCFLGELRQELELYKNRVVKRLKMILYGKKKQAGMARLILNRVWIQSRLRMGDL